MKWPWKHFILSIRCQRLTGLIETYLGWAASWNSDRCKSPSTLSNAFSTAERRQKSAATHHGIYEIPTFPSRYGISVISVIVSIYHVHYQNHLTNSCSLLSHPYLLVSFKWYLWFSYVAIDSILFCKCWHSTRDILSFNT